MAFIVLEFLCKVDGIAHIGRKTACYTYLFLCLKNTIFLFVEVRTIKITTFFHTFDFVFIFIEVVDWSITGRRLFVYFHWGIYILMMEFEFPLVLFITDVSRIKMKAVLKTCFGGYTNASFIRILSIIVFVG